MPTQKELLGDLRNEMEYLRESVRENSERHSEPIQLDTGGLEYILQDAVDALRRHEEGMANAVDNFADSIKSGVATLLGGLLIGGLIGGGLALLVKHVKKINQKTSLIKSIQFLQGEHPYLTYNFIIERSNADRANKEERQTILNELIQDGIVTSHQYGKRKAYEIKPDNPKLLAHWKEANEVQSEVTEKLEST